MIVKNEEDCLDRCLDSVHGLVDEIIVVDTGSTDRTVEIAQAHGARVEHFVWCDDFAAARNYSLSFAEGDWILILDADESLNPADHEAIRELTTQGGNAYAFALRNYFLTGNSSTFDKPSQKNDTGFAMQYPYYNDSTALRFWKAGPTFSNRIHELPNIPEFEVVTPVIHHYGKMNAAREATKRDYYFNLCKAEAKAKPMNEQLHFSLAGEAYILEKWEDALDAAKAYMRLKPNEVPLMMIMVAGASSQALGKHEHALYYLQKVLEADPNHALAKMLGSRSLFQLGKINEAIELIHTAIEEHPTFTGSYLTLMTMYEKLRDRTAAWLTILRALQHNPHDEHLLDYFDRLTPRVD